MSTSADLKVDRAQLSYIQPVIVDINTSDGIIDRLNIDRLCDLFNTNYEKNSSLSVDLYCSRPFFTWPTWKIVSTFELAFISQCYQPGVNIIRLCILVFLYFRKISMFKKLSKNWKT